MRTITGILIFTLGMTFSLFGQTNYTDSSGIDDNQVYPYADVMPSFPGGQSAMMEFLSENLEYPPKAKQHDIEGKVVVQFVVNKNGALEDKKVLRKLGFGCDEEVLRVLDSMPDWEPGLIKGKKVNVSFILPVTFEVTYWDTSKYEPEFLDTSYDRALTYSGTVMPRFPGGDEGLSQFLRANVQYPTTAGEIGIEGSVIVQFVVLEDGTLGNITIKESVHFLLDEEAIRVVKKMPKWIPASSNGKYMPVRYTLPITFRLN